MRLPQRQLSPEKTNRRSALKIIFENINVMKKKIHDKDIAEMVGISPCFFSRIINNKRSCPISFAKKLEEITNMDIRIWLFGTIEEKRRALDNHKQNI
jgi:transcriptional regulator with XRE-family HTH domain